MSYYATLPKKRVAACCLIYNNAGEVLIVKPNYRDYWQMPGGNTDEFEAPRETAAREMQEEIGVSLPVKRLLCIDFSKSVHKEETLESLQFVFHAVYAQEKIVIGEDEIEDWRFAPVEEALSLVSSSSSKRLHWAVRAEKENTMYYLENGENPFA